MWSFTNKYFLSLSSFTTVAPILNEISEKLSFLRGAPKTKMFADKFTLKIYPRFTSSNNSQYKTRRDEYYIFRWCDKKQNFGMTQKSAKVFVIAKVQSHLQNPSI